MGLSENRLNPYTQWFCWSLSLLNGYFIGGIPHFQTYPYGNLILGWSITFTIQPGLKGIGHRGLKGADGRFDVGERRDGWHRHLDGNAQPEKSGAFWNAGRAFSVSFFRYSSAILPSGKHTKNEHN